MGPLMLDWWPGKATRRRAQQSCDSKDEEPACTELAEWHSRQREQYVQRPSGMFGDQEGTYQPDLC